MSKAKIILNHRQHLIGRLLARNPLLRFRAPSKSAKRIDVCDLFGDEALPEAQGDSAAGFFRLLMEKKKADVIPPDAAYGRIAKIKRENGDLVRATGLQSLFLAWPFACVPVPATDKFLSAPLLFWKIKIEKMGQKKLSVEILDDEAPEYNFMLEAWLKAKYNLSLDIGCIVGGEEGESAVPDASVAPQKILQKIGEMADEWPGCTNDLHNAPYDLRPYADAGNLAILPCAVMGIAHFKYRSVLGDLKKLSEKVKDGESCGLLDEFLGVPSDIVRNPPRGEEPKESGKYLVETTDASQERAIWQARKSKVMLLKGPPGTGKSQTIVNLIADAMQKRETVALVCHKHAALNVVKKRLDGIHLGDLAVQITEPRVQRQEIIRGLRAVIENGQDNIFHVNPEAQERESCGKNIARLEMQCDKVLLSRGRGADYSERGYFRGKIARICGLTNFNPFDLASGEFIETMKDIAGDWSPDMRQKARNDLAEFAKDYESCNYENNRWRETKVNPDVVADVIPRFHSLVGRAENMDSKSADLPEERFTPILFGGIMRVFARQLFHSAKKQAVGEMAVLMTDTLRVFAMAKTPFAAIWREAYQGVATAEYRRYADDIIHLATVASINQRIQEDAAVCAFMQYAGADEMSLEHWAEIFLSVCCYVDLQKIPIAALNNAERFRAQLRCAVAEKRNLDSVSVRRQFMMRQEASQNLFRNGLLRLKRSKGIRASTVRDICHRGLHDFNQAYPSMLLNPDSMCQILPLEMGVVDLAIVDEASQMFVADALPILYRAKRIVIAGDEMQMPPDDLFALHDGGDDDEDESGIEYRETALDTYELLEAAEKIALDNSRCNLGVHYRSRPAELIAFSNHAFYGGRLQAAPDNGVPRAPLRRPIEVVPASGTFAKGVNEGEIDKIIAVLWQVWAVENPPSVGVIVFNITQANRLKDRLDEECKNTEFRDAYDKSLGKEDDGEDAGFFVRSVEHVQGDERDVIILGTTYNNTGNYGLLSHKGKGRRRLNVAVTRAKYGMFVVSSLNIGQISNEGKRPDGGGDGGAGSESWYLWKFMEYARAVSDDNQESAAEILRSLNPTYESRPLGREPESQFEKDVGDFVRGLGGYVVDYQIGESGFRIDIGVKQADGERYLCGIECDGRFWHSGWRARHNDVWRQDILEGKGWKIHRIWSDHWYDDAEATKQKLHEYLQERMVESKTSPGGEVAH